MATLLENVTATRIDEEVVSPPRTFRPDIEGLRAVAVLLVILYHAGLPWLSGGYVGVDVFFVISGFLITGLLLREFAATGRVSIAEFYARRARRILPIASVVLVATVAGSALLLSASRLDSVAHDGLWTSFFAANFHFAATGADYLNATAPPSPLQHYWSLAVEEQFYVLWPALLWLALSLGRRVGGRAKGFAAALGCGCLAASFVFGVVQTAQDANQAYFSPFTRGWELAAGALVAICAGRVAQLPQPAAALIGWLGLGLIAFSALAFSTSTAFPGSAAAIPVLGAVCVIGGGMRAATGGPERLLANRPMRRLGGYSYSLYLVHWPILIIAEGRFPNLGTGMKLLLIGLALVISAATYRWVETPPRRSARFTRSVRNSLLLALVAVLATAAYSNMFVVAGRAEVQRAETRLQVQNQQASSGTVATISDVESAVAAAVTVTTLPNSVTPPIAVASKNAGAVYSDGCLVPAPLTVSPPCVYGDRTSARTVVLFGDSHAAAWVPAFQNAATRGGFKLVVLAKGNCPSPEMTVYSDELKRAFTECDQWRTWALGRIKSLKPAVVVTTSNYHGARLPTGGTQTAAVESAWESGLAKTLRALKAAAPNVYMLSDAASHQQSVPECLAANPSELAQCNDPRVNSILLAHQQAESTTAGRSGVQYVDVTPLFCTVSICPAVINGIVTDFDENHMTASYSTYLGHAIGVAVGLEAAQPYEQRPTSAGVGAAVAASAAVRRLPAGVVPPVTLAAKDYSPAYADGCLVQTKGVTSPACEFGDVNSSKRVVLFGDSHAAQWMPALVDSATRTGFSVTVLTKGNCPAPTLTVYRADLGRAFTECDRWRQWALAQIAVLKPSMVVLSSTFHGVTLPDRQVQTAAVEAAWDQGLTSTIKTIKATGATVTVVGDVANHAQAVPDCLAQHSSDITACATPVLQANLTAHEATQTAVVKAAGAQYLNVRPWFCTATSCPAVIDGIVTDFDDSHLTATYSEYLGHALGVALGLES